MEQKAVKIISSPELTELRLADLAGRTGVVVAKGKGDGYWVKLDKMYHREREWFIPSPSLKEQDDE